MSQGSKGVMIFFSNRKTLEQEPCAAVYRTWARRGCPSEHTCLPGIGGIESTFCVGRFLVSAGHKYLFYVEKTLVQICTRLDTYINLHNDDFGTLHLTFESADTKIHIFTLAPDNFKAIISYSGWQKINDFITLTKENTKLLLHKIMKTTGNVIVDDNLSFKVERRLSLSICLVDESETQWNILQVSRSG